MLNLCKYVKTNEYFIAKINVQGAIAQLRNEATICQQLQEDGPTMELPRVHRCKCVNWCALCFMIICY